ncbi:MAG TPA: YciI family protein [Ktedonobacteraceae bacterium]
MTPITDEFMWQMLPTARQYSVVILKDGPNRQMEGVEKIVWEHGRNNFRLRAEGLLVIVCPVVDDSEVDGVGIFNASPEEVKQIMDEDPGVKAGVFVYEIHPCRGFPGDSLPQK